LLEEEGGEGGEEGAAVPRLSEGDRHGCLRFVGANGASRRWATGPDGWLTCTLPWSDTYCIFIYLRLVACKRHRKPAVLFVACRTLSSRR
jgi:hypothetical protein